MDRLADVADGPDEAPPDEAAVGEPAGEGQGAEDVGHALPIGRDDPVAANGSGPLTPAEAVAALEWLRDDVVRPESPDWEPHRSILRPAMIETFVQQRVADPADWYTRVPQYLRSGTTASEKVRYLEAICEVVARIGSGSNGAGPGSASAVPEAPAPRQVPEPGRGPAGASPPPIEYRVANPATVAPPDRDRFYDDGYRGTLAKMIAHVLEVEGPIMEDQLVDRVARAHGVMRSGGQIRRCVLAALPPEATCSEEPDGRRVVWAGRPATGTVPYRPDPTGARGHGDVPIRELASIAVPLVRLRMGDEDVLRRMADTLGIGRLREPTRARLQAALAVARASVAA